MQDDLVNRWQMLKDALALAERAPAYIKGEQWAISAVMYLRREVVAALRIATSAA